MSIQHLIKQHEAAGNLWFLAPERPGAPVVRDVFVTREVNEFVGTYKAVPSEFDRVVGQARAKIDGFTMGRNIIFALNPRSKDTASLVARNSPIHKRVVDMRINSPSPSLRIFGAFAEQDVLLLLTWAPRKNLNFMQEVARCRTYWDKLFPNNDPLIGTRHEHYISTNVLIG